MNIDSIVLTDSEMSLLNEIAKSDGSDWRKALHEAIFLFGMKVDYTSNIAGSSK